MTLIVVFFAIIFLLIGYHIMDKIDKFIEYNVVYPSEKIYNEYSTREPKQEVILICGDNHLTNLVKDYCNIQKYIYKTITEVNDISTEYKCLCLLALSYNDFDNLMVSSIGLKIYSISNIITLCNNENNIKIYKEFNFDRILLYNADIDNLFKTIKELLKDAIENTNKI